MMEFIILPSNRKSAAVLKQQTHPALDTEVKQAQDKLSVWGIAPYWASNGLDLDDLDEDLEMHPEQLFLRGGEFTRARQQGHPTE